MDATAAQLVKVHDGNVTIRFGGEEYQDTLANFALDAGEDFEPLPAGAIGKTYIPGEKHRSTDGRKAVQHSMPWPYGESLFPRVSDLLASQVARRSTPPPPPTREQIIAQKRALALRVTQEEQLEKRAQEPDPPPEVVDYINERNKPEPARS